MGRFDFVKSYNQWMEKLKFEHNDHSKALKQAIGGEFDAMGLMEKDILIQHGLKPTDYLIDVGCGSGRLSIPLSLCLIDGKYLGTDVVKDFLEYADKNTPDNFKFQLSNGFEIQEQDDSADMICFFSVFTHLLHEETYSYLKEAKRVLKSNGKIVFSFLEFYIYSHWTVFEHNVNSIGEDKPLDMFLSRDAISSFAKHLGMNIDCIYDGDKPHIKLNQSIKKENGELLTELGMLGQSVCVLCK